MFTPRSWPENTTEKARASALNCDRTSEAAAKQLEKRPLTSLYNSRPQWLADANGALDAAVARAYGWDTNISEEQVLAKLLQMNRGQRGVISW